MSAHSALWPVCWIQVIRARIDSLRKILHSCALLNHTVIFLQFVSFNEMYAVYLPYLFFSVSTWHQILYKDHSVRAPFVVILSHNHVKSSFTRRKCGLWKRTSLACWLKQDVSPEKATGSFFFFSEEISRKRKKDTCCCLISALALLQIDMTQKLWFLSKCAVLQNGLLHFKVCNVVLFDVLN